MWIIPSTISHFVPGTLALTLDCDEFSRLAERSLMWRSKPSPARTWRTRWKREPFVRLLSGRICIPSHFSSFEDWWTSSAEDSPVSRSAQPVHAWELKTKDTFGPGSSKESETADPLLFSSRMLTESRLPSHQDSNQFSTMSSATWKAWVTGRRQTCTQRKNSAHRTSESDGSSLECPTSSVNFPTPTTMMDKSRMKYTQGTMHSGQNLIDAVLWPTPTAHTAKEGAFPAEFTRNTITLTAAAQPPENWPTPTVAEAGKVSNRPNHGQKALSNHPAIQGHCNRPPLNKSRGGLPDQDRSSTIGKSKGQLNPDWVEQLMGVPPGWTRLSTAWTVYDFSATE